LRTKHLHELLYDIPLQHACGQTHVSTTPLTTHVAWFQYAVVYFSNERQQTAQGVARVSMYVCMYDVSIYTVQTSPFNGRVQGNAITFPSLTILRKELL